MMTIDVRGLIVPDDYAELFRGAGIAVTAPKDIVLPVTGEDVVVQINSPGGVVMAGAEIYSKIKNYSGQTTVEIQSMAASAASVIAMAGKTIRMSPAAAMMIHNVSTSADGDYREMAHQADVLKTLNVTIANAYRLRTGMSEADILAMMDAESWMSPQRAVQLGLADEIIGDPESVLTQTDDKDQPKQETDSADSARRKARAKLNLLRAIGARK